QNRNLNAVDEAQVQAGNFGPDGKAFNPRFDNNRFGGNIGGPVIKNKIFLFGGYEYNPIGQAAVPAGGVCTPTAAGYATLATIPGLSANNLSILKQYATAAPTAGCPTEGGNTVLVGNPAVPVQVGILPIAGPNFINNKAWYLSGDWNISQKDQFRVRYVDNKQAAIDIAATLPAFYLPAPTTNNLF